MRRARTSVVALLAICAAAPALAVPVVSETRPRSDTWEQHGSGRTDGYAVGVYPLPSHAGPEAEALEDDLDGTAKERWLRRHYQWLRALRSIVIASDEGGRTETEVAAPGPLPARPGQDSAPDSDGTLRVGDMVVLYAIDDDPRMTPHLLDDGGASEDPETVFSGGEVFEFVVSDRLSTETAQIVSQFFAPLTSGLRAFIRPDVATPDGAERQQGPRYDLAQLGEQFFAQAQSQGPARAQAPREALTLTGFIKRMAIDILSAPTTYLVSLLALLAWLILRATVFTRP